MSYTWRPRRPGEIIDAERYNTDHQTHIDARIPSVMDPSSRSLDGFRTHTSPGHLDYEVLPLSLKDELYEIRYALRELRRCTSRRANLPYWYSDVKAPHAFFSINDQHISHLTAPAHTHILNTTGVAVNGTWDFTDNGFVPPLDGFYVVIMTLACEDVGVIGQGLKKVSLGLTSPPNTTWFVEDNICYTQGDYTTSQVVWLSSLTEYQFTVVTHAPYASVLNIYPTSPPGAPPRSASWARVTLVRT